MIAFPYVNIFFLFQDIVMNEMYHRNYQNMNIYYDAFSNSAYSGPCQLFLLFLNLDQILSLQVYFLHIFVFLSNLKF